jgi:hypothetical protein
VIGTSVVRSNRRPPSLPTLLPWRATCAQRLFSSVTLAGPAAKRGFNVEDIPVDLGLESSATPSATDGFRYSWDESGPRGGGVLVGGGAPHNRNCEPGIHGVADR